MERMGWGMMVCGMMRCRITGCGEHGVLRIMGWGMMGCRITGCGEHGVGDDGV